MTEKKIPFRPAGGDRWRPTATVRKYEEKTKKITTPKGNPAKLKTRSNLNQIFMSILPDPNPGSTTSSSSSPSPSQSSTSDHGFIISSNKSLQFSDSPPPLHAHATSGEGKSNERRIHSKNPIHQNGVKTSHPDNASSSQITPGHSTGKKSQTLNGNHLLNFHYDPIPVFRPQTRAPPPRRYQKRRPYNKDLFLQANYKFVVLDSGNYVAECMDPDKMLSWDEIICLKYSSPFPVHCPICLDDLLCPQITLCSHIFCFPCILQYFLIGEEGDLKDECWKKCPLCFAMISSKDLYTICIENVKQYKVGDEIEFVLLTREKGSFSSSFKNSEEEILDSFSKFMLTSDVELSVREAMSDLDSWIARANSGLVDDIEKLPYVCAAIEQLERRKKYWNEHRTFIGDKESASFYGSPPMAKNGNSDWYEKSSLGEFNEPIEEHEKSSSSSIDDNKNSRAVSVGINERKYRDSYNFYQATDGQHLILHPLSMKCLLHHYGNSEIFLTGTRRIIFSLLVLITGKILQLETVTQSEAMRRRYRFLSHISLTTTFQLCEIDLRDKLPAESLSPFMDEIKNREKQRKQLARKVVDVWSPLFGEIKR
ncbi:ring finger protein 10 [Phtheirospermum japonicum]|uniref:Ring finger protein 10 n=1 Tax=Phtheirospermum japonicum TaxID=374723 RepID=A0A830BYG9_9LAMI|nr:ring finger protein 10 [Phtheirospermum japonicum]